MAPTPSPRGSSFQDHFRFARGRRPRNANPYDAAHSVTVTPTQPQVQIRIQALPQTLAVDPDAGDANDFSDTDADLEDGELDEEGEGDDEEEEIAEEEEGGIEEGTLNTFLPL